MGTDEPVEWETIAAAMGPPADEVTRAVERYESEVTGMDPYDAVKTIHDALYDDGAERSVPSLAEPFITAYLLEQRGVIDPNNSNSGEYRSIVDRRPSPTRLRTLFWERHRTLWWIGLLSGVHPQLVSYWLYEDDIPLMERNFTAESLEKIRAIRDASEE